MITILASSQPDRVAEVIPAVRKVSTADRASRPSGERDRDICSPPSNSEECKPTRASLSFLPGPEKLLDFPRARVLSRAPIAYRYAYAESGSDDR